MKLLLDEQVPARLAREFPEKFDVHTVQKMGWASAKNGELLKLAAAEGFVALVSADKNMQYQQSSKELASMRHKNANQKRDRSVHTAVHGVFCKL